MTKLATMNATASADIPPPKTSNKAYPVLLTISTCLSAVLCWLYVTKPVLITPEGIPQGSDQVSDAERLTTAGGAAASSTNRVDGSKPQLIPSDDSLPGMNSESKKAPSSLQGVKSSKAVDPRLMVAGDGSGWETTNARVQHILSADTGDGELSKIVLNVPVLYETRTMRWTPADVQQARDILTRLMVYENNISKLKQEGKVLLVDWNKLLEKTVPSSSLRADSPSLPYNHSHRADGQSIPSSGSTIKIEQ